MAKLQQKDKEKLSLALLENVNANAIGYMLISNQVVTPTVTIVRMLARSDEHSIQSSGLLQWPTRGH